MRRSSKEQNKHNAEVVHTGRVTLSPVMLWTPCSWYCMILKLKTLVIIILTLPRALRKHKQGLQAPWNGHWLAAPEGPQRHHVFRSLSPVQLSDKWPILAALQLSDEMTLNNTTRPPILQHVASQFNTKRSYPLSGRGGSSLTEDYIEDGPILL